MRLHSRFNATKHGVFAEILSNSKFLGEAEEHLKSIGKDLRDALHPTNAFENIQIDKLAFLYLRLTRLYSADWQIAPKMFAKLGEVFDESHRHIETAYVQEGEEVGFLRRDPAPDLLMRYETNIERQIVRTLDLFLKLRAGAESDGAKD